MYEQRIVYLHPGQTLHYIRPQDVVMPVTAHPAVVEDLHWESQAHGNSKTLRDGQAATRTVIMIVSALENGPATIRTIVGKTGLSESTIHDRLINNLDIFEKSGERVVEETGGRPRYLYQLTASAKHNPRITKAITIAPRMETGALLQCVADYLRQNAPAPLHAIVGSVGASETGVYKTLRRNPHLFREIAAPTKKSSRRVIWECIPQGK